MQFFDKEESLQVEKIMKRLILSDMAFISWIVIVLPEDKDRSKSQFMLTSLLLDARSRYGVLLLHYLHLKWHFIVKGHE